MPSLLPMQGAEKDQLDQYPNDPSPGTGTRTYYGDSVLGIEDVLFLFKLSGT
jgi:hypothetical protein